MQLLKPAWVSADGHALMSIDIHPDGTRFATGGQGTDCGRVCIWNMKPIIDANAAKDKNVPKLLTQVKFCRHFSVEMDVKASIFCRWTIIWGA